MQSYFIWLFVLVIGLVNANKCEITEDAADKCGSQLMVVGNRNFTLPKDENDVLERCNFITGGIKCYKNYAKNCLDPFSKQIMSIITKNGNKMADKICKTSEGRKEFIKHMQCYGTEERMAPLHLCMDKYIVQMERLGDISDDQRIPTTCCTFHMLRQCTKTKGQQVCDKPESNEYFDNIVTGITGDLINIACGKYKDLQECDAKLDTTSWQMLKDLVASDDPEEIASKKRSSSPFAALREVLNKFKP